MAKRPTAKQLAARERFARLYGRKKSASRPKRASSSSTPKAPRRKSNPSMNVGSILANPIVRGTAAGAASNVASRYIGPWGAPAALGAVGFATKDRTLQTLAGVAAGNVLMSTVALPGGAASPAGGVL